MNVLLVQPPDSQGKIGEHPLFKQDDEVSLYSPWSLLCVRAYILGHTRHHCQLMVCEQPDEEYNKEIVSVLENMRSPRLAVIYCSHDNLGEVESILGSIKRLDAKIPTAIFGPFPSAYPNHAQELDECDFLLSGDPEPILRNLLDFIDVPQRLRHTPGLTLQGEKPKAPSWLTSLDILSLPKWEKAILRGSGSSSAGTKIATLRLSRGHTGTYADRAYGGRTEPLRVWRFENILKCFKTCSLEGISLIALEDTPGFWTQSRLDEWCSTLTNMRNDQPWSFQIFPREIDPDLAERLFLADCRQINFIMPSCKKANLAHFNCNTDMKTLGHSIKTLLAIGIEPRFTVWIGGPEESSSEAEGVLRFLRMFSNVKTSLQPFPYFPDSDLFAVMPKSKRGAEIEDIIKWLKNPWIEQNPVTVWSGQKGHDYTEAAMTYLARSVSRSPKQLLREIWKKVQSVDVIRTIEDRALSLLIKNKVVDSSVS